MTQREYELAARFLGLPPERRKQLYSQLQARGIELARLPIPVCPPGPARERLSYAQERLWFLAQLDPGGAAYNMAGALRLYGEPERAALQGALQAIVARHEALRTAIETRDGVARARVHAELAVPLQYTDARREFEREGEACVRAWAAREAEAPFDLSRAPLLRVRLVRFGAADFGLFVCLHHIVSDGWSLALFIDEFAREYAARVTGSALELPELRIQYPDYAAWQRSWLEAGELERQLSYFRAQLGGAQRVLALPADRPRPGEQSQRGARLPLALPPALASDLRGLARARGVTLFMLGLAAFKALLLRVTGERDIRVGSSVANRQRLETEALIGCFVNTQVLRSQLSPEQPFAQLLAAVAELVVEAQGHQDAPFEQVANALAPERSLGHNPLFQVHYDHQQRAYASVPELPGLRCEAIAREQRSALFDLQLTTIEQPGGSILASFEYATDLFDRPTIELLAARYVRLLAQVVAAPQLPLGEIELVSDEERPAQGRECVLAPDGRPLPAGLAGELWIAQDDGPLRATGELARLRRDGVVERLAARAAPPAPQQAAMKHASPEGELELQLAAIWRDVLQIPRVSATDNFFELGGDSIVSIQVVSRARELGIALRPKDMFAHQTVRELAQVARRSSGEAPAAASDAAALTPIQAAFFARQLPAPDHYNQSLLLECLSPLDPSALEAALQRVVAHHPALRTAFEAGVRQVVRPAPQRISSVAYAAERGEIEALCDEQQRSLSLERGEVFRALYVRLPDQQSCLLLVAHHLVMDGVSFRILLEDLERSYTGLPLPAATAGFTLWSERLQAYAASDALARESGYWREVLARVPALPRELDPGVEPVTIEGREQIGVRLDREWTERLLQHSAAAYRTQIQELLLAAFARAACEAFDQRAVGLWLEGHGREDLFEDVDVSRSVGWFTSEFPVVLEPRPDVGATIRAVKELLRAVPARGLGYGVIAWLGSAEQRSQLSAAAQERPRIAFNYLGQFDAQFGPDARFRVARERAGAEAGPDTPLAHWLEVNGQVYAGELALWISFSPRLHRRQTVQRLAERFEQALREVVTHCTSPGAGAPSPADYPLAGLDQAQLDLLVSSRGRLADIYPVTPMQHGMLFHALYDAEPGVYVTQLTATVDGLDPARFRAAWQRALERHAILRTSFAWRDLRAPLQCVHARAELAFELRDAGDPELLAREQHRRGFDLERAPLFRVALVRLSERRYRFIWTHHHLLLDGWSTARLLDEVLLDYLGRARPEPSRAFGEYVAWLARRDGQASEAYWRERLAGVQEPTLLASHTAGQGAQGARSLRTRLTEGETSALAALARAQRVTLNTLVQSAWALLLARYTGQRTVVFGATTSGRPPELAGSERMLGLFINTLPVAVELQPAAALHELWQQLQRCGLEAREHESTPLARLQRLAAHAGGELFDTLVVVENFPLDRALAHDWQSLAIEAVEATEITSYALTLAVRPAAALELDYGFDPARIAASAVVAIAQQLLGLLRDFCALPAETCCADLSLPGEPARQQPSAAARVFEPVHASILRRVAARANTTEALVAGASARLGAAEIERVSSRLAYALRARGVRAETRVALYAERGPWLIAGALGILRAGGAYVPLDPAYPPERLQWMLADAGVRTVLGTRGLPELPGVETLEIEAFAGADLPLLAAEAGVAPDQLAYLIYTSGSTGTPKGVGVSHAALAMHAHAVVALYGMGESDCAYHQASASFDASVEQWVVPLLSGARLVLSPEQPYAPRELARVLRSERVTVIYPPTSQIIELSRWLEQSGESYTLRACCVGGEAVSRESVALIRRTLAPELLINGYGPTETVVTPLLWRATAEMACRSAYAPIGHVVGERSAYVLDADLNVLPRGVAGELYIGGAGTARGYLGRPGLTAERFVPDPFAAEPGARSYRTGDRVRALEDGTIEYLGRIDHQVKLRGYRIELGEIEARLLAQPEVRDSVVVVDQEGSTARLVGYVASSAPEIGPQLLARLREALPEHMVPAQLVVLGELPRTPNGKLDRRALPRPERQRREPLPPSTPRERELLADFEEVLGQQGLGVADDFFELGGDSLSSLQLLSRAEARGLGLTLRDVFALRTVQQLAAALDGAEPSAPAPPIERVPREREWHELSYAQARLWFLAQLEPDSPAYNIGAGLRVRGPLDPERVRRAFDALAVRHAALRTSFEERAGRGMQRIQARASVPVRIVDAAEEHARELFAAELLRPFDLASAPLVRVTLLRIAPDHHVLLVSLHHLIADGWSLRVLMREFAGAYASDRELPEPALQYVDYAAWQRSWLERGELARQLEYWRAQLGDEHPVLALPFDHPRPRDATQRGASVGFALDAQTSRQLIELARALGASTFMLLLAAFEGLLYRYTGQRELRVGVPMSGRGRLETESLVGLFVNTLVLRAELDGALCFRELVARVKDTALAAQSHRDLPFERLVEALQVERSLHHNPLFQVMFDHQRGDLSALRALPGLQVEPFEIDERPTQFDLALDTIEEAGLISGSFTYAAELFERASIEAMSERFCALLRQVALDPGIRLAELELLGARERDWLRAVAEPRVPAHAAGLVFEHIAARASARPDAIALIAESGERWSYARLERESNQWAHELRARGVRPEQRVGLCVGRSPQLVLGSLAIMKSGGVLVALDPSHPGERLRAIAGDAGVQLILAERAQLTAAELGAVLWLDPGAAAARPHTAPSVVLHGHNLAYVAYTSGSTGCPKGVGVSHAALAQHALAIGADYGLGPEDCCVQFASLGFDAGIEQWLTPLCSGARVLVRGDQLWAAERAFELLREHGVTWLDLPPGYATELARAAAQSGEELALRGVCIGGEALPREGLALIAAATEPAELINCYGPTEAVITPLSWHGTRCDTVYAPIGRAVGARRAYVLDRELNLVPHGVTGELYIAGPCLARGYVGLAAATAERFVPDPFGAERGSRMYRTGDLARLDAAGDVEFLGRADAQLKVRGYRVEPGEVEAQLLALPGVREALVIAQDGRLIGYVSGVAETATLLARLRQSLPEYLVPAQLISLPALPRGDSGKIDRKRLPAAQAPAQRYVAPETPLQVQLCAIWGEVLGAPRVGLTDNFFELGGDSLRSLRVISRARSLGIELRPRDLFERQTIGELSQIVRAAPRAELVALPRDAEVYRLSYAQERLWFLAQLEPDSAAYNIAGAVRLEGALDTGALSAALSALAQRHEALRTTFELREGEPWQRLHERADLRVEHVDLSGAGEDAARERFEAAAHAPFDLERGPLVRVLALRLSATDHVLGVVMHHIISDGWSLELAIAELSELYLGARAQALPTLALQPIDVAHWQRARLAGPELERQLAYWKAQLGTEHPVLRLPYARRRPALQTFRGAAHERTITAAQLVALARAHDVTLFMLLLAAWQTLLYRLSGLADIRVGVPVADRDRLETEGLIGLFVNTQVLRSELRGELRFSELLSRVKECALGAAAHRDLPFERLVEELAPERSLAHNPLFQVTYNHASAAVAAPSARLLLREFAWRARSTQFDLSLDTEELPDQRLGLVFTYATDMFDAPAIERLADLFVQLLAAVAAEPEARIAELALLADPPRAPDLAFEAGDCEPAQERVFAHARSRPDALAVECGAERATFGALAAIADAWAAGLTGCGVGPEVRVGVCVDRSLDALIAPLAIWRAGGVYVPLDPELPTERLRSIATGARLALVLTGVEHAERISESGVRVLPLADLPRDGARSDARVVHPDALAYVIHTSGSTGTPKGVAVSYRALARHISAVVADYGLDASDCALQFAPTSFDTGLEQWLAPLAAGARVVLRGAALWSAEELVREVRARGVTRLDLTPGYLRELAGWLATRDETLALRGCISGGEALPGADLPLIQAALPGARCINAYGPTEAVITPLTWHAAASCETSYAPIGRPVGARSCYVLDPDLGPVPPCIAGELYIGGPLLARGYLDQPAPSAERFLPDPFSATPGARMYRTGDRVRGLPDGTLEYLGRIDQQLKIRGHRVEPGEIEAQLRAQPGVREAIVTESATGGQLVAYVGGQVDAAPLRERLRELLPEYMLPSQLVVLDELPRTAAGKIDRGRLPLLERERRGYVAPATPFEVVLAAIWRDVLGAPRVSAEDDFFELGGHSLLAMRVVSRVFAELSISLPVRQLFETQSLAELARALERMQGAAALASAADEALRELEDMSEAELAELSSGAGQSHE